MTYVSIKIEKSVEISTDLKYLVFNNFYFFRINHNPIKVSKPLIIINSTPIL